MGNTRGPQQESSGGLTGLGEGMGSVGLAQGSGRAYFQAWPASRGPCPVFKAHSGTRSMPSSHWQRPL